MNVKIIIVGGYKRIFPWLLANCFVDFELPKKNTFFFPSPPDFSQFFSLFYVTYASRFKNDDFSNTSVYTTLFIFRGSKKWKKTY